MIIIKAVSIIIYIIAIMAIWKNTISFDLKQKLAYIGISILIIAIITNIICAIGFNGIKIDNKEKQKIIENTIKHIFIPINLLIYSTPIGVLINKLKDNIIKKEKFNKSVAIITLIFVVVLIFETNYISGFYRGVLNV